MAPYPLSPGTCLQVPSVAKLAARILRQLQETVASHLAVLTKPEYLADPVAAAEAALRAAATKFGARAPASQQPSSLVRGIAAHLHQFQPVTQAGLGAPGLPAPFLMPLRGVLPLCRGYSR